MTHPATPPDAGLQAERTSLSWARTWAVLAATILLVSRLVAETSPWVAIAVATTSLIPLTGLMMVRTRHRQRVERFVLAEHIHQGNAVAHLTVVGIVVLLALTGCVAVVYQAVFR